MLDPYFEMDDYYDAIGDPYDRMNDAHGERDDTHQAFDDVYPDPDDFSDRLKALKYDIDNHDDIDDHYNQTRNQFCSGVIHVIQPATVPEAELPCCDEDRSSDLPTNWTIQDMLEFAQQLRTPDHPVHDDRRECRGLEELRQTIKETDMNTPCRSVPKLQDLFHCLNEAVFQGRLSGKCRLKLHHGKSVGENVLGSTEPYSRCTRHQQVYGVRIHVYIESPFHELLETMLHEMIHAFIFLYLDLRQLSCLDYIINYGWHGHGRVFQKLLWSFACFLQHTMGDVWSIDAGEHLDHSMVQCVKQRQTIRKILEQVLDGLPKRKTYSRLRRALTMKRKDGGWLKERIMEGRDILEIVIMLFFEHQCREYEWRRPCPREGNPRSIVVEGLEEGEYKKYLLARL